MIYKLLLKIMLKKIEQIKNWHNIYKESSIVLYIIIFHYI